MGLSSSPTLSVPRGEGVLPQTAGRAACRSRSSRPKAAGQGAPMHPLPLCEFCEIFTNPPFLSRTGGYGKMLGKRPVVSRQPPKVLQCPLYSRAKSFKLARPTTSGGDGGGMRSHGGQAVDDSYEDYDDFDDGEGAGNNFKANNPPWLRQRGGGLGNGSGCFPQGQILCALASDVAVEVKRAGVSDVHPCLLCSTRSPCAQIRCLQRDVTLVRPCRWSFESGLRFQGS